MLSRGKIKLIGATTFDEYQKHIEKDAALKRRFQEINVDEPTGAQAIEILTGLKERFDSFHDVNISPKAIEHAVGLSMRYILNKHLPDKAIDLIDEAAARKSVLTAKLEENNNYQEHIDQLAVLEKQITKAVNEQDYYKAAELKQQESYIKNTIKQLRTSSSTPVHLRPVVDEHDIGKVISEKM
jgi:ATP-dependent Clp protease ATP-binding subunit ClpC